VTFGDSAIHFNRALSCKFLGLLRNLGSDHHHCRREQCAVFLSPFWVSLFDALWGTWREVIAYVPHEV